jgi:uncharacterized protein YoxC
MNFRRIMNFRSERSTRNLIFSLLLIAIALVVFLISAALYSINESHKTTHNNQAYIACVLNWANETTHRSNELTDAAQNRQNALDRVVRDVAEGQNPKNAKDAAAKFQRDIQEYVRASDAYNKVLKEHPVPKSPKLACANVKK